MNTVALTIKRILLKEPFYGLFLCGVNRKFSTRVPTACVGVSGIDPYLAINKDLWYSLEKPEYRYALLKHEILHLCFGHIEFYDTWKVSCTDPQMLNIAADLEVESYIDPATWIRIDGNLMSVADIFFDKMPHLPKRQGTKYYIDFLKRFQSACNSSSNNQKTDSDGSADNSDSEQAVFDDADLNQDFNSLSDEDKQNLKRNAQDIKHTLWEEYQKMSSTEKRLIKDQIEHQLKETAKAVGEGSWPSELKGYLTKLITPKPPIFNWKGYFRRLLGVSYDINLKKTKRKESLRFPDATGLKKNKKYQILVAIDTSGSVSRQNYKDFFSEILNIYKAGANIHILECDYNITASYDFKGKMPEQRSSSGGTSFLEPVNYFNDHRNDYSVMVYLTDGYGDQKECHPFGKMIWVITSNGNQDSRYPGYKVCIPKDY